jgi:DNA polymerase I-like protein with 3'-5' exonuclease and polymerase domains
MGFMKTPRTSSRAENSNIAKRASSKSKSVAVAGKKTGNTLIDRINNIIALVNKTFPNKSDYILLKTPEEFKNFVDKIIEAGLYAYDTETSSLDPISCDLAGFSFYIKGEKPAYVSVGHVNYITGEKLDNQMPIDVVKEQLARLLDVPVIMHNAKFDIRVIRNKLDLDFAQSLYWDTIIGAHLLNELDKKGLKWQWNNYCCTDESEKSLDYESLFDGLPFTLIPIHSGYLYAAKDTKMTFDLYEFQKPYLTEDSEVCKARKMEKLAKLFHEVEVPLVGVTAEMEDNGVSLDLKVAEELSVEYHEKLKQKEESFYKICEMYSKQISDYKLRNPKHGLDQKINYNSPTQVGTLIYAILKLESPDKRDKKTTGSKILVKINHPICKAILECRGVAKLLGTYIDKLPGELHSKTGKIHANFNQVGTETGRYSSDDPNLQNIPSKDKKIRTMFVPSLNCYLISCDFSQQEPRVLAHFSQDEILIEAYRQGKDIYAFLGEKVFKVAYEDCLEKRADGTANPEGKVRRDKMKIIVLALMYGLELKSLAESLKVTIQEAASIKASFFKAFPSVDIWINNLLDNAHINGYVETAWGRRRRLANMLLSTYEFSYIEGKRTDIDPLFDSLLEDSENISTEVDPYLVDKYTNALIKARNFKEINNIKESAKSEGIKIKDNSFIIGEAERQSRNSPIQGSSGDMVKNAMVRLRNLKIQEKWIQQGKLTNVVDLEVYKLAKEFEQIGGRIILQIHDELMLEAPIENVKRAAEIVSQVMIKSAASVISVPMKCDISITSRWNGEELKNAS